MKKLFIIVQVLLSVHFTMSYGQGVLFSEDFESGEIPLNWTQEFRKGSIDWRYENGGYTLDPDIPFSRNPMYAHGGQYNALFQFQSLNSEATKLVTKKIQALEFAIKPELHFYNAQIQWKHGSEYYHDYLKIYYKTSLTGSWNLLKEYNEATTDWVERIILLPENDLSTDYYLAFEGETKWGYGTCVDDIQIIETGILQKYLSDISIEQASDVSVSSGTTNNPILRINLKVMGNSGSCPLNSLVLSSLNSDDTNIEPGGVKLFLTTDAEFNADDQVGTGVSFASGQAVFSNLDFDLPMGYSYLWITYDIKPSAGHRNLIDAKLAANSLNINGQNYFTTEESPTGSRTILQTLFSDDFETESEWTLTGEFEYGSPLGLGGSQGNPDPDAAFSGSNIIGTDLTGLGLYPGDYEKNLALGDYSAISDTFDLTYYNDLTVRYMRFLNIGINDEAFIDVSPDGGKTWETAWNNQNMILDDSWKLHEVDITTQAARKDKVMIRYSIGTTNDYWQLSGWNIDDFSITGNYITKDVGVGRIVSPLAGCGHTNSDSVTVMVKNYGASDSYGIIPLKYSFNGGTTMILDTLYQVIPFGDSASFTFKKKADLSVPDIYSFIVSTSMTGDEDLSNDAIAKSLYIQPSIGYDYTETFESKGGLWIPYEKSVANWEWGTPALGIVPPSGTKVWMTKLTSNYPNNDSSFVESVCYKNDEQARKILRMKYWVAAESDKDGAAVQYSTDNGLSWQLLDTLITGYEWYNDTLQALNSGGWSGNSDGWISVGQILPKNITDAPLMKFRLAFASDAENNDIGFAFDDFRVSAAPFDIGVSQIDTYEDACQFVNPDQLTVTIKNFGINTLKQNDTIIVGFDLNESYMATDTFSLSADLMPGQTIKHTFTEPIDVTSPGNYNLTAYTLIEDDPWFYFGNNDTASLNFEVYPLPVSNLFDTIQTREPDTVVIRPFYDPQYDYLWHDLTTEREYHVHHYGWHTVNITAARGNGCSVKDSTYVELLFNDVGVDSLIYPVDHCGLTKHEYVTVRVHNFGTDSIVSGQKIAVIYELDAGEPVADTLVLTNALYSGDDIDFSFSKGPVDLSAKGIYSFKIYTSYGGDTIRTNDTIISAVEILGRPAVDIGPDLTVQTLSYTLDAGSGYVSYYWDNEVITQTREITETGTYWVQVFDENQCDNFDTAYIRLKIRDVSPGGFVSPVSDCRFDPAEPVALRILNSGTDTIPVGTTVAISYLFQEGTRVTGSMDLSAALLPDSCVVYTFPETLNLNDPADYNMEATTTMAGDIRTTNDTSKIVIYRYDKPVVDFGLDDTEIIEDISLQIEAGYSPYYSYQWQDGYSEHLYTATTSGLFHVIATDTRTSCFDRDSVTVYLVYSDVGVVSSDLPLNGCAGEYENVRVMVQNLGPSNIGASAPISVACDVNGARVTVETLVRTGNFASGATLELTLSDKVILSNSGINQVAFYTLYSGDKKHENDTLVSEFDALPGPVVDFGDVDGWLTVDLPHVLDAGTGHKSYLWQDESSDQTYIVTQNGIYSVVVTGQNDCQTNKTVRINMINGVAGELKKPGDIIIYPNPNNGLFSIALETGNDEDLSIRIISNQGQIVYIRQFKTSELAFEQIDVQHLSRGVYEVVILTKKQIYQGKMIIQ